MHKWKKILYDEYVVSGQAHAQKSDVSLDPYFTSIIKKFMPLEKTISVVDLACGHGALIYCLKKMGYVNVEGVDVSHDQIVIAQHKGINNVVCSGITDYLSNKKECFDVIFLIDILEHLTREELINTMGMVFKALKDTGIVIIQVPNGEGLFGMRIRYGDLTHEICFTETSIRQILNITGFKNIKIYEIHPIIHGIKSFMRWILWHILFLIPRIMLIVESGILKHVISANMIIISKRRD